MFVREYPGTGRGTLVFIHGLGESGLCFERVVVHPRLRAWRRLVPDLPGYGRSAWPSAPQSLVEVADHLAAWLGERGEPPVTLVGHSMGGVLALLMAERHAERVQAIVDVEGNKSLGDCTYSGQAAAFSLEDFCGGAFDRLREALYRKGHSDLALRGYHVSQCLADPATFHRHSLDLVDLSREEELAARLGALGMPHVYVAGTGLPGGAAARSLELIEAAGVPYVRIAPAGHWPFIDRPEDFIAALCQQPFLA